MVEQAVAEVVKRYLRAVSNQGIPVLFGIVYGSQVRGNPDTWSDIDLLVVSPKFDAIRHRKDVGLLWRVAARIDSRIEPVAVGQRQFEEDDSSAIVEIARREGQIIAVEE